MRLLPILTIAAAASALAACGEGSAFDNGFRTSYREKAIGSCSAGARAAMPAGVQVDVQRVCTCAVARHREGTSASDRMGNDDPQAAQAATERCLREEMARLGGGSGSGAKPAG